jgi:hypothetical protein
VLPAPIKSLELEALEPDFESLELEPHAASPSEAAIASPAAVVRISFVVMRRILDVVRPTRVSDP